MEARATRLSTGSLRQRAYHGQDETATPRRMVDRLIELLVETVVPEARSLSSRGRTELVERLSTVGFDNDRLLHLIDNRRSIVDNLMRGVVDDDIETAAAIAEHVLARRGELAEVHLLAAFAPRALAHAPTAAFDAAAGASRLPTNYVRHAPTRRAPARRASQRPVSLRNAQTRPVPTETLDDDEEWCGSSESESDDDLHDPVELVEPVARWMAAAWGPGANSSMLGRAFRTGQFGPVVTNHIYPTLLDREIEFEPPIEFEPAPRAPPLRQQRPHSRPTKEVREQQVARLTEWRPEASAVQEAHPSFVCPITHEVFRDPVILADGHTYERNAIKKWLKESNASPMTQEGLAHMEFTDNIAVLQEVRQLSATLKGAADKAGPSTDNGAEKKRRR
jgi:hypothetical protein